MGNYADINRPEQVYFGMGKDGTAIRNIIDTKVGGAVLDLSDFAPNAVMSGHLIIHNATTGKFKPMPVNTETGAYGSLPEGYAYFGVNISTFDKDHPFAGVLIRGTVNINAMPYNADSIAAAVKTALPHIIFITD